MFEVISLVFIIFLAAVALLSVGWLLTGKRLFKWGMCGRIPTEKRSKDKGCEMSDTCSVCGKTSDEKEELNDKTRVDE